MTDLTAYCHQCDLRIAQPCLSTILEFMRFTTAAVVQGEIWSAQICSGISDGDTKTAHASAWDAIQSKFFKQCAIESGHSQGDFDVERMIKMAAYVTAFELQATAISALHEALPDLKSSPGQNRECLACSRKPNCVEELNPA